MGVIRELCVGRHEGQCIVVCGWPVVFSIKFTAVCLNSLPVFVCTRLICFDCVVSELMYLETMGVADDRDRFIVLIKMWRASEYTNKLDREIYREKVYVRVLRTQDANI